MLLQTNSYIVPKERRAEHARLLRRFRQVLMRLGCDLFEVYEQMGPNWGTGDQSGRFVQIMRFRDRKHQREVHAAEQSDPAAQQLINEFCELINLPYQQQQGMLAIGYYQGVMDVPAAAINRVAGEAPAATGRSRKSLGDTAAAGFGLPPTVTGGMMGGVVAGSAIGFGAAAYDESTDLADEAAADEAGEEAYEEEPADVNAESESETVEAEAEDADSPEAAADVPPATALPAAMAQDDLSAEGAHEIEEHGESGDLHETADDERFLDIEVPDEPLGEFEQMDEIGDAEEHGETEYLGEIEQVEEQAEHEELPGEGELPVQPEAMPAGSLGEESAGEIDFSTEAPLAGESMVDETAREEPARHLSAAAEMPGAAEEESAIDDFMADVGAEAASEEVGDTGGVLEAGLLEATASPTEATPDEQAEEWSATADDQAAKEEPVPSDVESSDFFDIGPLGDQPEQESADAEAPDQTAAMAFGLESGTSGREGFAGDLGGEAGPAVDDAADTSLAADVNGLPTHLIAEEGEIEITFESLPDFMAAAPGGGNSGHSADGGDDEIEAALNEALRE